MGAKRTLTDVQQLQLINDKAPDDKPKNSMITIL